MQGQRHTRVARVCKSPQTGMAACRKPSLRPTTILNSMIAELLTWLFCRICTKDGRLVRETMKAFHHLLINDRAVGVVEIEFLCSEIQKLRGITSNMLTFDLEIS